MVGAEWRGGNKEVFGGWYLVVSDICCICLLQFISNLNTVRCFSFWMMTKRLEFHESLMLAMDTFRTPSTLTTCTRNGESIEASGVYSRGQLAWLVTGRAGFVRKASYLEFISVSWNPCHMVAHCSLRQFRCWEAAHFCIMI